MVTKAFELIEIVRNALEPKYEFPYYALVRINTRHYGTVHIPAPIFNGGANNPRSIWAGNLPIAADKRDYEYYKCPFCENTSFYAGPCEDCQSDWETGQPPLEYRNREALKASVKEDILRMLDSKAPLVGVVSAEIVLACEPNNICDSETPFLKKSDWNAQRALDRIEEKVRKFFELIEKPEIKTILEDIAYETGVPFDYIEGDVITVEGSDEVRRYVNGVWQHKHEGYDYWHPMARVHKESMIYPLCEPDMDAV